MGAVKELLEAFGLVIKTKETSPESQIVKDANDDGAHEVITSGGGVYYDGYYDVLGSLTTDRELIAMYREISFIPEVDQAIMEIVNDAVVYPKAEVYPVRINLDAVETISDPIKEKIVQEFDTVLGLLQYDTKADDLFRKWYVDGRLPLYMHVDPSKLSKGISKIIPIDSTQIKKVRELKKIQEDGVEKIAGVEEKYWYFPDEYMPGEFTNKKLGSFSYNGAQRQGIELSKDSVVFSTSGLMSEDGRSVLSYLHKAIKPSNQLSQIEDAMIVYRVSRAPERRVFYIDTGNLPKSKAEQYLQSIMAKFKNKLSYDGTTGKIKNNNHVRSILEDYWLPRRGEGKGTEVTTLAGGTNFAGITEETNYFKHKLYKALNVPIGRLDSENTFVFGKSGEITRDEIKFSKFVNNLRNQFAKTVFDELLKTQLVLKKIIKLSEWEEISNQVFYQWEDDSHFAEMKSIEIVTAKSDALDKLKEYVDIYFSRNWVRKNILYQSEEEMKELEKERKKEKQSEPPMPGDEEGGKDSTFTDTGVPDEE